MDCCLGRERERENLSIWVFLCPCKRRDYCSADPSLWHIMGYMQTYYGIHTEGTKLQVFLNAKNVTIIHVVSTRARRTCQDFYHPLYFSSWVFQTGLQQRRHETTRTVRWAYWETAHLCPGLGERQAGSCIMQLAKWCFQLNAYKDYIVIFYSVSTYKKEKYIFELTQEMLRLTCCFIFYIFAVVKI